MYDNDFVALDHDFVLAEQCNDRSRNDKQADNVERQNKLPRKMTADDFGVKTGKQQHAAEKQQAEPGDDVIGVPEDFPGFDNRLVTFAYKGDGRRQRFSVIVAVDGFPSSTISLIDLSRSDTSRRTIPSSVSTTAGRFSFWA